MKSYSIGREGGCDIVINDPTDVISRRHAVLTVMPSGKMTITDQSHNGTYVNGMRISPNVPVPVTRKDNISFAHVAPLDWNQVPKTTTTMTYIIISIVALLVIAGVIFGCNAWLGGGDSGDLANPEPETTTAPVDSAQIKQQEQARLDSINQAQAVKAQQDSIEQANKAAEEAKSAKPATNKKTKTNTTTTTETKKAEEQPAAQEPTRSRSDR